MKERGTPIQVEEALERILHTISPLGTEKIDLGACDGRRLGEDVCAAYDLPPFDRSPYDGYAVRAEDTYEASQEHPVTLEIIEEIPAGRLAQRALRAGQASRIMTGAKLPVGCDAIVMQELTQVVERDGKRYVLIKRPFRPGDHISYQGEECARGTLLVTQGTVINPGVKALLAAFGYAQVPVMRQPLVGVLATGTELVGVDEPLPAGKIRNSNATMIVSQIKRSGAVAVNYGRADDEIGAVTAKIKQAMEEVDIVITTGGVSVGDYDFVPTIYEKLGAELLFDKVAMRPGSVTSAARLGDKLLIGLSGNPSACYVGFELFVRPLIRKLTGVTDPRWQAVEAFLAADFPKANPFNRYVRANVSFQGGMLMVEPSGKDKSNVMSSLASCNALMLLPGGTRGFERGAKVEVYLLDTLEP
ncbi:molybdopterin molybdotransferase MoeA [Brevibacillus dissolubilis]|uniref:molybdopterin molybdotransferase MoeA n=1 Tax=Brevibacillus dissolubilis TaxID=1844116 RepID=UPI001116D288|nr:gephyrin-like molybdotransferase Glp [Brevibacillus dissolubilis]